MIADSLIDWYRENKRELPWRHSNDPYIIWISEIMCQQTTVGVVKPYFERFIASFPNVCALASASEQQVLNHWQGLGYYSRARNLHATAKEICEQYSGVFPNTYQSVKSLKGIGEYTAGAIVSIAYGEKYAAVDGNAIRVLSRLFGIFESGQTSAGKGIFEKKSLEMAMNHDSGEFNQALMEFGALHCTPRNPKCSDCPIKQSCYAFINEKIDLLPVKKSKTKIRDRCFYYFILTDGTQTLLRKRSEKDVWLGLYEFPLIESKRKISQKQLQKAFNTIFPTTKTVFQNSFFEKKQKLSHQNIWTELRIVLVDKNFIQMSTDSGYTIAKLEDLQDYPMPQVIKEALLALRKMI
jgi:A/G-specific adenine glycosylase